MTERLLNNEVVTYDYIYNDIYRMMADFTDAFPNNSTGFNEPVYNGKSMHGAAGGREWTKRRI